MHRPCQDEEEVRSIFTGWPVQALVLVSFVLQVLLFVCAGFRRRSASKVLRVILWLAYLGADSVATYTLGHLSIAISSDDEHLLVAFWAPFLLLHLGGQDTITAYALEDNKLWLRHLQTLVVQVLAAAYVIFLYYYVGRRDLLTAAVLMFLAGATKYGERIWALKCASNDGMYSFLISYCKQEPPPAAQEHDDHVEAGRRLLDPFETEEKVMYGAHSLLGISMCMFLDREEETCRHNNGALSVLAYLCSVADADNHAKTSIYRVIEMELSLIYDLMYTKARVIHTVYGFWIRVVSLLIIFFTGALMFLFLVINENRADVGITYLLWVGAFLMEVASGFFIIVSTWTRHQLNKYTGSIRMFYTIILHLRRVIKVGSWRSWSGTVGQFNMIEYCAEAPFRVSDNICGISLRKKENLSGLTPPVHVSAHIKDSIRREIASVAERFNGAAERMYALVRSKELLDDNSYFDTRVIIWHIATHLILDSTSELDGIEAKAIKTLSDYMMFLLIEQPDMMPGHTRRNLYMEAIKSLKGLGHQDYAKLDDYSDLPNGSTSIAGRLLAKGREVPAGGDTQDQVDRTCMKGARLAVTVLDEGWGTQRLLEEMLGVWVEMLRYAGSQCTRDSHARRLTSGGEFLTIVWLLTGHFADYERLKQGLDSRI